MKAEDVVAGQVVAAVACFEMADSVLLWPRFFRPEESVSLCPDPHIAPVILIETVNTAELRAARPDGAVAAEASHRAEEVIVEEHRPLLAADPDDAVAVLHEASDVQIVIVLARLEHVEDIVLESSPPQTDILWAEPKVALTVAVSNREVGFYAPIGLLFVTERDESVVFMIIPGQSSRSRRHPELAVAVLDDHAGSREPQFFAIFVIQREVPENAVADLQMSHPDLSAVRPDASATVAIEGNDIVVTI